MSDTMLFTSVGDTYSPKGLQLYRARPSQRPQRAYSLLFQVSVLAFTSLNEPQSIPPNRWTTPRVAPGPVPDRIDLELVSVPHILTPFLDAVRECWTDVRAKDVVIPANASFPGLSPLMLYPVGRVTMYGTMRSLAGLHEMRAMEYVGAWCSHVARHAS